MTKVFLVTQKRTCFSRRPVQVKKQLRSFGAIAPGKLGSARVECTIDYNKPLSKQVVRIEVIKDETLITGAPEVEVLSKGRVKKAFTLQGFINETKKLSRDGGLGIDFKTRQKFQEIFHLSQNEQENFLAQHIEETVREKLNSALSHFKSEKEFKFLKCLDLMTEALRKHRCALPLGKVMSLYYDLTFNGRARGPSLSGFEKRAFAQFYRLYEQYNAIEHNFQNIQFLNSPQIHMYRGCLPLFEEFGEFYKYLTPEGERHLLKASMSAKGRIDQSICDHLIKKYQGMGMGDDSWKFLAHQIQRVLPQLESRAMNNVCRDLHKLSLKYRSTNSLGATLYRQVSEYAFEQLQHQPAPYDESQLLTLAGLSTRNLPPDPRVLEFFRTLPVASLTQVLNSTQLLGFTGEVRTFSEELSKGVLESLESRDLPLDKETLNLITSSMFHLLDYSDWRLGCTHLEKFKQEDLLEIFRQDDFIEVGLKFFQHTCVTQEGKPKIQASVEEVKFSYKLLYSIFEKKERCPQGHIQAAMTTFAYLLDHMEKSAKQEIVKWIFAYTPSVEVTCEFITSFFVRAGQNCARGRRGNSQRHVFHRMNFFMYEWLKQHSCPDSKSIQVWLHTLRLCEGSRGIETMDLVGRLEDPNLIFSLPQDLFELCKRNKGIRELLQLQFGMTDVLRSYMPSMPLEGVRVLSDTEFDDFLKKRVDYSDGLKGNLLALWNKGVSTQERGLKKIMQLHLCKMIELNRNQELPDDALKAFFSNIQHEHAVCMPGCCQKVKLEYRQWTLPLSSAYCPDALKPSQSAQKLRQRFQGALEGASEDMYLEKVFSFNSIQKQLEEAARVLVEKEFESATQREQEIHKAIKELKDLHAANVSKGLSEEAMTPLIEKYQGLSMRGLKILVALSGRKTLSDEEIMKAIGLSSGLKFAFPRIKAAILKSPLFKEVEGVFVVNEEEPQLAKILKDINRLRAPDRDFTPAVKEALRRACDENPRMQEAKERDVCEQLKVSVVMNANLFFDRWVDAHLKDIQKALVERYLKPEALQSLKAVVPPLTTEQWLKKVLKNIYPYVEQTDRATVYQILSSGWEVHLLVAAKHCYHADLGLDPKAIEDDFYAREALKWDWKGAFSERVAHLKSDAEGKDQLAFLNYMADQFNNTAGAANERIDHAYSIQKILARHLDATVEDAEKREAASRLCFTPEKDGVQARITPFGVNLLLRSKEFALLQSCREEI